MEDDRCDAVFLGVEPVTEVMRLEAFDEWVPGAAGGEVDRVEAAGLHFDLMLAELIGAGFETQDDETCALFDLIEKRIAL